jgi:Skp family chaperone for outer membrane proteins
MGLDRTVLAEMQKKLQREIAETERRTLEYWRGEIEKMYKRRHENLAALQVEIKSLMDRMDNRMRILRKEIEP